MWIPQEKDQVHTDKVQYQSATKLSDTVWKGTTVSTNYTLVLEAAAPCRHKDVTSQARLCTIVDRSISNSLAAMRTDFVELLANSYRTLSKLASEIDGQPSRVYEELYLFP
ncbi:hypothetical protein AVEN_187337-1 [Araneus ventricosus]|uniref:Uncharacterized protein n=1 Tax=Araneus ventricosus TaxID=182803 RepID=A0A4Y2HZD8_ARAVE|nr:hypothetical protein AVEN_187337-1 [Araneus ventricosus]